LPIQRNAASWIWIFAPICLILMLPP